MGLIYQSGSRQRRVKGSEVLSRGSVHVRGESIYYEASGMAEDGPTVLFLHESGGTSATWQGQLVGLAQNARCIVPDLPGHGRSEGAGCVNIGEYRQAVLDFLDALAIRWPVVVAGVCLGAAVATDLVLHEPCRVAALILSGVSPSGRACNQTWDAAARGEVRESFVASMFGPAVSQRLLNETLQRWRLTSPIVWQGDLTAVGAYPMVDSLRAVSHPALLLAGEQDPIATPALAREIASDMQNARVESIPNGGCLAMMEQTAAFNRTAREFLGRLGASSPVTPEVKRTGGYRRF